MSPVIGMIMVLAVSVVGIAAVLYWGLPAIDDMKANVEFQSLESQLKELNADVRELVAGTAGKTAKRWQPSMNRGELAVETTSHRWAVLVNSDNESTTYDFHVSGWNKSTAVFGVLHKGSTALASASSIKAYQLDQDRETLLTACSGLPAYALGTCTAVNGNSWTQNTEKSFFLNSNSSEYPMSLTNVTVRVDFYDGDTLAGRFWVMDLGSVHYRVETAGGDRDVYLSNGAVVTSVNGNSVVSTAPPIPPPRTGSSGTPRVFLRAIHVAGEASYSGSARFDMLLNLYSTSSRAEYSCSNGSGDGCVDRVRVYVQGDLSDVFSAFLTTSRYGYEAGTQSVGGEVQSFVQYPSSSSTPMAFNFVQSVIVAEVA